MARIGQIAEKESLDCVKAYSMKDAKQFVKNLQRIMEAPEDPRFESVQMLLVMLKAGQLPEKLGAWLQKQGLSC